MNVEHHTKRRNLSRWRESRLRRLEWEERMGRATPQQVQRIAQLRHALSA